MQNKIIIDSGGKTVKDQSRMFLDRKPRKLLYYSTTPQGIEIGTGKFAKSLLLVIATNYPKGGSTEE
jgi:hypothetical protein